MARTVLTRTFTLQPTSMTSHSWHSSQTPRQLPGSISSTWALVREGRTGTYVECFCFRWFQRGLTYNMESRQQVQKVHHPFILRDLLQSPSALRILLSVCNKLVRYGGECGIAAPSDPCCLPIAKYSLSVEVRPTGLLCRMESANSAIWLLLLAACGLTAAQQPICADLAVDCAFLCSPAAPCSTPGYVGDYLRQLYLVAIVLELATDLVILRCCTAHLPVARPV